jgi:hypothetical protein
MNKTFLFRKDETNAGDWYCLPSRFFPFEGSGDADILGFDAQHLAPHVVVGGGGLLAKTFHPEMHRLAACRPRLASLVAWGLGESEHVDRKGGFVLPYAGPAPTYLQAFDLVGVRDFGTSQRWVPCASCLLPQFDRELALEHEVVIYEHKRIPVPIDAPFPRRSNAGNDIDAVLAFLASGRIVITNSYHGAYWATLLGRRVLALANMSKMYRFKHAPVIARAEHWRRAIDFTREYPQALAECRQANREFHRDVLALQASRGA